MFIFLSFAVLAFIGRRTRRSKCLFAMTLGLCCCYFLVFRIHSRNLNQMLAKSPDQFTLIKRLTSEKEKSQRNLTNPKVKPIDTRTNALGQLDIDRSSNSSIAKEGDFTITQHFNISVLLSGHGLGNLMFMYASLYGIAKWNNMTTVIGKHSRLNEYFDNLAALKEKHWRPGEKYTSHVRMAYCCKFEPRYKSLKQENTELNGYYQSWKYFDHVKNDIREQFRFNTEINSIVDDFFQSVHTDFGKDNLTKIGLHVRRGDIVTNSMLIQHGHLAANISYINRAIDYFKAKYPKSVFIVCSNDIPWCKENIQRKDVVFSVRHDAGEDLAILSRCDHMIVTVGTYGWWGAWLAGGDVVYFKDWPRPNSGYASSMVKEDYYPQGWKPL